MDKHLLIVEDDEWVQSLLAAYMKNEGFKVSLAANGKEIGTYGETTENYIRARFSPNGRYVLTKFSQKSYLYDLASGDLIFVFSLSASFSPDGRRPWSRPSCRSGKTTRESLSNSLVAARVCRASDSSIKGQTTKA